MNCTTVSNYIIDYIDKKLDNKTSAEITKHMEGCSSCRIEFEQTKEVFSSIENMPLKKPNQELKTSFLNTLQREKSKLKITTQCTDNKIVKLKKYKILWQVAAAVLLLISGYLVGYNSSIKSVRDNQVTEMQNDIAEMKQQMYAINLLKNESASQRIKAVNYTEEIQSPSNETIEALINTLKTDPSSNVRLAAVYSLSRFKDNQTVKNAFINTLNQQNDPMVQIVIINLLVEMEEVKAVDELKQLLKNKDLQEDVKSQAELGVKILS
jgi:phosphoribosylformylglycinamidine (FGAM) synthase PurS component